MLPLREFYLHLCLRLSCIDIVWVWQYIFRHRQKATFLLRPVSHRRNFEDSFLRGNRHGHRRILKETSNNRSNRKNIGAFNYFGHAETIRIWRLVATVNAYPIVVLTRPLIVLDTNNVKYSNRQSLIRSGTAERALDAAITCRSQMRVEVSPDAPAGRPGDLIRRLLSDDPLNPFENVNEPLGVEGIPEAIASVRPVATWENVNS